MRGFAEILLERGLVNESDLDRARDIETRTASRPALTLVRLGMAAEEDVAAAQADATGRRLLARDELAASDAVASDLNRRFLQRRVVLPVEEADGSLLLAMADPTDENAIAAIAFATGRTVTPAVATLSDISDALGQDDLEADRPVMSGASADLDIERLLDEDSEAPIIRAVQRLLSNAVNRRASDVHIEPMARQLLVRYRIDGRLVEVERLQSDLAAPIASRIKVMAALDIAESRLPQDGRLRLTVRGRDVDVRVSTSPTAWGESIVLRLLGRTEVPLDLERLGLPGDALAALHRALDRPHGIILLTGPTGSGKTTTLYAAINRLRRPEVKILTVEDPVEVMLEGINQVQVRPEIDLSYAATLRAFLRQDPDILMIGEIRDQETAEIALRAALTGHLVLSTLHTNSALGAFTRLADIGIEPYLTASTVIAAIAQRLIRGLCPTCQSSRGPTEDERIIFGHAGLEPPSSVWTPVGCPECLGTGYLGRIPLIEVVEVDEALREKVRSGAVTQEQASNGLLSHGLALVATGRTDMTEVQRAVALR